MILTKVSRNSIQVSAVAVYATLSTGGFIVKSWLRLSCDKLDRNKWPIMHETCVLHANRTNRMSRQRDTVWMNTNSH